MSVRVVVLLLLKVARRRERGLIEGLLRMAGLVLVLEGLGRIGRRLRLLLLWCLLLVLLLV